MAYEYMELFNQAGQVRETCTHTTTSKRDS